MFTDGLGIVERRVDRPGMQGVVIVLIDVLAGIQLVECILGIVISIAIVDVGGSGDVEGQGPVGFLEPVPEGKVRAVDVEAGVVAGRMSDRVTDG